MRALARLLAQAKVELLIANNRRRAPSANARWRLATVLGLGNTAAAVFQLTPAARARRLLRSSASHTCNKTKRHVWRNPLALMCEFTSTSIESQFILYHVVIFGPYIQAHKSFLNYLMSIVNELKHTIKTELKRRIKLDKSGVRGCMQV